MRTIVTENPLQQLWALLSPFMYPKNVRRLHSEVTGCEPLTADEFVASSIRQAREYFALGEQAGREIAPVLLYYGAMNLLLGAATFLKGSKPNIKHHGMNLHVESTTRIADARLTPRGSPNGALSFLLRALGAEAAQANVRPCPVSRVFAGIADLHEDFQLAYPEEIPGIIPVYSTRREDLEYYRLPVSDTDKFGGPKECLQRVTRFSEWFCDPVMTDEFVILYPQIDASPDIIRPVRGGSFLRADESSLRSVPQVILYVLALFSLSSLCRYQPEEWIAFIRDDETGERLFVEQLLAASGRVIPNVALDLLKGEPVRFVFPTDDPKGIGDISSDELERRIEERVEERLRREE